MWTPKNLIGVQPLTTPKLKKELPLHTLYALVRISEICNDSSKAHDKLHPSDSNGTVQIVFTQIAATYFRLKVELQYPEMELSL